MPAAPPGTIVLSCTTSTGPLTITARYDPDTGVFNADALTATGVGTGQLEIALATGGLVTAFVDPGVVITSNRLAAQGVTDWADVHSIILTAVDTP